MRQHSWKPKIQRQAVNEEVEAPESNNTREVVQTPDKVKLIDAKRLFKIKINVARGYRQRDEVDYSETYSPVARLAIQWNVGFNRFVLSLGFKKSRADSCLQMLKTDDEIRLHRALTTIRS